MKRFYSIKHQGDLIYLENEEATHCTRVLRCKTGDAVEVLNGTGLLFKGVISAIQKNEVQIEEVNILKEQKENPNKLSIAICPTKNPSRLEWFVEKATEIGIANIYPVISDRTEKTTIKHDRLQQIIISAAKQSGQLFFPVLHPIRSLKDSFSNFHPDGYRDKFSNYFIAHCEDEKIHLKDIYKKNGSALLLIGPEGDFTKDEVQAAVNNNYIPVSLGNSILRVETAGVVACSIVNSINFEK